MAIPTVAEVKANLIIEGNADDNYLSSLICAAVSYAEGFQHLPDGYYITADDEGTIPAMPERTKQAIIMLVTNWYESRDGSSSGFFANSPAAAQQSQTAIDNLLRLDRDWKV